MNDTIFEINTQERMNKERLLYVTETNDQYSRTQFIKGRSGKNSNFWKGICALLTLN